MRFVKFKKLLQKLTASLQQNPFLHQNNSDCIFLLKWFSERTITLDRTQTQTTIDEKTPVSW